MGQHRHFIEKIFLGTLNSYKLYCKLHVVSKCLISEPLFSIGLSSNLRFG